MTARRGSCYISAKNCFASLRLQAQELCSERLALTFDDDLD
jgi:hypothetical protein